MHDSLKVKQIDGFFINKAKITSKHIENNLGNHWKIAIADKIEEILQKILVKPMALQLLRY